MHRTFFCSLIVLASLFTTTTCLHSTNAEEAFTRVYKEAYWGRNTEGEGFSGTGSTLEGARLYMIYLQDFLASHQVKTVVDAGCGDWEFSRYINWSGIRYDGYDVVQDVIEKNRKKFASATTSFHCADITCTDFPAADLFICKDVMQHLLDQDIHAIAKQFSKFKYCIIMNGVDLQSLSSANFNLTERGGYRTLDLTVPPYNFKATKVLTYLDYAGHMKQVILIERGM